MGEWTVRQARVGDGAGLAEVHLETARGYLDLDLDPARFQMPSRDGLAEWLDEDLKSMGEQWVCFVAVDDGRIVGQIEAHLVPPMDTARYQAIAASVQRAAT